MVMVESIILRVSEPNVKDAVGVYIEALKAGEVVWKTEPIAERDGKPVGEWINPYEPDRRPAPGTRDVTYTPMVDADYITVKLFDLEAAAPLEVFVRGLKVGEFSAYPELWQEKSFGVPFISGDQLPWVTAIAGAVIGGIAGYLIKPKEPLVPALVGALLGAVLGGGVGFTAVPRASSPESPERQVQYATVR